MKKRICNICVMALMGITSLSAFDLNELLKSATSGNNSSASDIISGIVNAVTSTSVEYADLVGNWKYSKPAVTFSSDNLLQNAGGVAASTTIVNKLKPYYTKARLNNMTLTFGSDSTFVAKTTRLSVSGTVTSLGNGSFQFNIKALGKIPAGSITAFAQKQGSEISLTFDAQKLVKLVEKIASLSRNSTLQTVSNLVNSYDGVNIGLTVKKQ